MTKARRGLIIRLPPTAVLVLLYLTLVALGSVLLMLPAAAHQPVDWSEAIFTAASAATVTGLVVVDTGSHFTLFGQIVILVLIQLGGLGIVTFAVLILCMLGLPVGLTSRNYLREELHQTSIRDVLQTALAVVRIMLVMEAIGVALLALEFVPRFGWAEGLWQALFHTVSAFNNAGFGLFPDSLSGFVSSPIINYTIMALIVAGGLGFPVLSALCYQRRWRHFDLHTRLMLVGTLALTAWAVATFAVIEWHNPATLGGIAGTGDRLTAALFQAITPRTAGFNTVDIGAVEEATALFLMLQMYIGAGSASAAGGIKVTTFIVMLMATVAFFRRRDDPVAFGRSLNHEQIMKMVALIAISLAIIMTASFLLILTQPVPALALMFETVSAFGTVGLSIGATGQLDGFGRAVLICLMILGRVGPLALGLFLATRLRPRLRYPEGNLFLG